MFLAHGELVVLETEDEVLLGTAELVDVKFPRFDGHPRLASRPGRECPKWDVHRSTAKSSGPTRLRWS